jgi:uncharacterized membrane protein
MYKLSAIAIMAGVILSFHDTLYPWALAFVVVWAGLASIHFNIKNK